jgi:hypothetical protein
MQLFRALQLINIKIITYTVIQHAFKSQRKNRTCLNHLRHRNKTLYYIILQEYFNHAYSLSSKILGQQTNPSMHKYHSHNNNTIIRATW